MNTPTLTSAQLGRRLGTGLKIYDLNNEENQAFNLDDFYFEQIPAHHRKELGSIGFDQVINDDLLKPILYNFDMLTKEITHNGETFVPIDEIEKRIRGGKSKVKEVWMNALKSGFYHHLPYWIIQLLLSWHFRIDEPEGTFIDVSTLDENPYK